MNQINKTDLEIIEIVEPYMNKELVEGCYFFKDHQKKNMLMMIDNNNYIGGVEYDKSVSSGMPEYFAPISYNMACGNRITILGTLDITAILKCIKSKIIKHDEDDFLNIIFDQTYIEFEYLHPGLEEVKEIIINSIPNKPYTTYTQKEKENLLEILKSLK